MWLKAPTWIASTTLRRTKHHMHHTYAKARLAFGSLRNILRQSIAVYFSTESQPLSWSHISVGITRVNLSTRKR